MAIICAVCNKILAAHRSAGTEVGRQIGAYTRHLKGAHGIEDEVAKQIARNTSLHTLELPESMEQRWEKARRMWAEGMTVREIACEYEVSEKAMRTRIRRWRNGRGWFPVRQQNNEAA